MFIIVSGSWLSRIFFPVALKQVKVRYPQKSVDMAIKCAFCIRPDLAIAASFGYIDAVESLGQRRPGETRKYGSSMPDTVYRININVADIRSKPKFKSERITQALYNERVTVLKKGDDYCHVKLHDGYKGYVKKLFLSKIGTEDGNDHIISSPIAPAFVSPDENSPIVTMLPFAAELKSRPENDGFVASHSPRCGDIYLRCSDLIPADGRPRLTKETIPQMLEMARRFIGVPYLWGGRSYFGFDCSGFINVIFKFFGLMMPRKTKDQVKFGRKVPYGEIETGDLLFFRAHAGIALNRTDYIHSSLSQGGVHINTLDPNRAGYLRYRDLGLRAVRRFIPD